MQLLYTPNSHFARKVRLVAATLGVELQLLDVGNVANLTGNQLELNPLMKVPTLIHGHQVLFDSQVICEYLVRHYDPADRLQVLTRDPHLLNARTVMNGVMAAEVELFLAARMGVDIARMVRGDKYRQTIAAGLAWLEHRADSCLRSTFAKFHLVCMWDHLEFVSHLLPDQVFPQLQACIMHTRQWLPVQNTAFRTQQPLALPVSA